MTTRVLYLDDSGKPDANHASNAVVIAGLAVDADHFGTLSRRLLGAKSSHFPSRGAPQSWEVKSADLLKPNPWKRSKNRNFVAELIRVAQSVGATTYAATIDKTKMKHTMSLATSMPLQLQCLVEHFASECQHIGATGLIVADSSSHHADQHASACVASFAASRDLPIHPCVYYASSHTNQAIQVADVIAAVRRRTTEGDVRLAPVDAQFANLRPNGHLPDSVRGYKYTNYVSVF